MENKVATLVIRYKAADGKWRRGIPARAGNGRLRNGSAVVDGVPRQVEQYQYQVLHYVEGQSSYTSVGKDAYKAETRRVLMQQQAAVKEQAAEANLAVVEAEERKSLRGTAKAYIKIKRDTQAFEAASQAVLVTEDFLRGTKKEYVDQIKTGDITHYHERLRKRGLSPRTIANKDARLASWLRFAGLDKGVQRGAQGATLPVPPRYEETLPTMYNRDQVSTLLGQDDPYMHMVISVALKLGLREQELMHAEYRDINWHDQTFRVQGKPRYGFSVKTHEQRDIPIPDDLLIDLREWQRTHPEDTLILATTKHTPSTHLLRALKRLAKNADINCGHCDGCRGKDHYCEEYTLHKFRRTYITTLLRSGIDLRTVQAYAGHKDLASTMRYLRPASGEEARAKVNAVRW